MLFMTKTNSLEIAVEPRYDTRHSDPLSRCYNWLYTITIHNSGEEAVTILRRHWRIVDTNGFIQEVVGEGVVGQQPMIRPTESYEYTSMASLLTKSGMMLGCYDMISESGRRFVVDLPPFSLDSPEQISLPN